MSTNGLQAPVFIFPPPGPALPPSPDSSIPPIPVNYTESILRWYLESALQNNSHPSHGFGSSEASIRAHDYIETKWTEPNGARPSVDYLTISCLVCDEGPNQSADASEWAACNNYTSYVTEFNHTMANMLPGGKYTLFEVPQPDEGEFDTGNERKGQNKTMACMFALYLVDEFKDENGRRANVLSQLFTVKNKPRGGALYFSETSPYIFNSTNPLGTPANTYQDKDWSAPTATSVAAPDICIPSRRSLSCHEDGWGGWSNGKKAGVLLGGIAGSIIIGFLLWYCIRKTRFAEMRQKPKPILLSELRAEQRARGEEQRIQSNSQDAGGWRHGQATTEQGATGERIRDDTTDLIPPPPAYHEIMSDQERRDRHHQVQAVNVSGPFNPPTSSITHYSPPIPAPYYDTRAQR